MDEPLPSWRQQCWVSAEQRTHQNAIELGGHKCEAGLIDSLRKELVLDLQVTQGQHVLAHKPCTRTFCNNYDFVSPKLEAAGPGAGITVCTSFMYLDTSPDEGSVLFSSRTWEASDSHEVRGMQVA